MCVWVGACSQVGYVAIIHSNTSGHVHNEARSVLGSGSKKLLKFIVLGHPGAAVCMHRSEYAIATKDGAQLERLLMHANLQKNK